MTDKPNPDRVDTIDRIKPLSQYKDAKDFCEKTGMSLEQAYDYLMKEYQKTITYDREVTVDKN